MKRILMVKREIQFAVAVEISDGTIEGVKVLTSATEAKMLLEQSAPHSSLTTAEKSALGIKP